MTIFPARCILFGQVSPYISTRKRADLNISVLYPGDYARSQLSQSALHHHICSLWHVQRPMNMISIFLSKPLWPSHQGRLTSEILMSISPAHTRMVASFPRSAACLISPRRPFGAQWMILTHFLFCNTGRAPFKHGQRPL